METIKYHIWIIAEQCACNNIMEAIRYCIWKLAHITTIQSRDYKFCKIIVLLRDKEITTSLHGNNTTLASRSTATTMYGQGVPNTRTHYYVMTWQATYYTTIDWDTVLELTRESLLHEEWNYIVHSSSRCPVIRNSLVVFITPCLSYKYIHPQVS